MGFASLVQNLIDTVANPLTKDFQASVTITPFTGSTGFGVDSFGPPITNVKALVDRTVAIRYAQSGRRIQTVAKLTILDKVPTNGTVTDPPRREPLDPRDKITLDDGTTAPIVEIPEFENAESLKPFIIEVTIGRVLA